MAKDIYEFVKTESATYKVNSVKLTDGWQWSMYEHIRKSFLYKNSKFTEGGNDGSRPFDNIILPVIHVAYRSEGFDVKDIVPYVNDPKNYYKSFLIKKYHPRWARENDLDTFIDDLVESYVDYGLALVQEVDGVRPEVVPLEKLAFADQTDVLSGALGIEHEFTPSELKKQTKWDSEAIQSAIDYVIERNSRQKSAKMTSGGLENATPTPYIRVYEVHGEFPESWLKEDGDPDKYVRQMQIITLYEDKDANKGGICLFKGKSKNVFKALKRDKIYGRACGRGAIEELFDPQVWTNYDAIQVKEMLDVASLMIVQTADKAMATRQKINELEKGEMLYYKDTPAQQLILQPINKAEFDRNTEKWEERARLIASADEALLGKSPTSGTPFRLQALVTQSGLGLHEYRQGKIATFVAEIYRDWILKYIVNDINKGQKFLEELSVDELTEIAKNIATNEANKKIKEMILKMKFGEFTPERVQEMKQARDLILQGVLDGGTKRFIEVLKGEFDSIPVDVEVNVAGKQKNLVEMTEKLVNIFRAVIQNPAILQNEGMGKLFNEILESSGLSPINFASFTIQPPQPANPEAIPNLQPTQPNPQSTP